MSKTRPVKGVGWDVSAIGNGQCCHFCWNREMEIESALGLKELHAMFGYLLVNGMEQNEMKLNKITILLFEYFHDGKKRKKDQIHPMSLKQRKRKELHNGMQYCSIIFHHCRRSLCYLCFFHLKFLCASFFFLGGGVVSKENLRPHMRWGWVDQSASKS